MAMAGCEIFSNGSGSHHQLRKLDSRLALMLNATAKCGGAYVYANQRGCDGTRLYFDGSSMVCVNGECKAQASQFSLRDVEVVCAVVDLDDIRAYRNDKASMQEMSSFRHGTAGPAYGSNGASGSMGGSTATSGEIAVIDLTAFSLRGDPYSHEVCGWNAMAASPTISPRMHTPEEECALGPACWLWDYLRRSKASGFFLPLSGVFGHFSTP